MGLTVLHVLNVCREGEQNGLQCRYLATDRYSRDYICLKKTTNKKKIDEDVSNFLRNHDDIDPQDWIAPLGDNCQGYPLLKNIEYGYDIE